MVTIVLSLLLISVVSSYICIDGYNDNTETKKFKAKLNALALQEDLNNGLNPEQINTKLKYFSPCR